MEEDRGLLKFVCKLCNKKYPCGKSLGGHMRSHVIANLAESEEKFEPTMKKVSTLMINSGGKFPKKESKVVESYGLRENPKKTWRAVDSEFPLPQEKVCKQCGKVFQSLKALCGHMACHSEKERGAKDDHSWTSENQKLILDSQSDTEAEDRNLRSKSKANNKRYKRIVIKSSSFSLANNGSSSVSEIDEQEQEEVAISLMMLSKDSGNRGGVNSVVESSDNNSVVLESKSSSIEMRIGRRDGMNCGYELDETPEKKKIGARKFNSSVLDAEIVQQEDSDSGYFLGEASKGESYVSIDRFRTDAAFWECEKAKASVGSKLEESGAGTKKGSKSKGYKVELRNELAKENGLTNGGIARNSVKYESKKRTNACFDDDTELVAESCKRIKYGSSNAEVSGDAYKRSRYKCLNCKRTFKSYQALGGHRPCHKKSNACLQSRYDSDENSSDADNDTDCKPFGKLAQSFSKQKSSAKDVASKSEKKIKSKKHKGHVCPFCHRVFKSGQALGGHKRSHFLGGNGENSNQSPIIKSQIQDLFDLNLPAPVEDEDDEHVQLASW